jgi:hypothetical protein
MGCLRSFSALLRGQRTSAMDRQVPLNSGVVSMHYSIYLRGRYCTERGAGGQGGGQMAVMFFRPTFGSLL